MLTMLADMMPLFLSAGQGLFSGNLGPARPILGRLGAIFGPFRIILGPSWVLEFFRHPRPDLPVSTDRPLVVFTAGFGGQNEILIGMALNMLICQNLNFSILFTEISEHQRSRATNRWGTWKSIILGVPRSRSSLRISGVMW